jgi:hypothetical protein
LHGFPPWRAPWAIHHFNDKACSSSTQREPKHSSREVEEEEEEEEEEKEEGEKEEKEKEKEKEGKCRESGWEMEGEGEVFALGRFFQ